MSEISIYDIVPTPKLADKLIGTSVGGVIEDVTYNFTLQELLQLFIPNLPANNLQGVLDYGNTATQNINLTGTITTTNLSVLATANILNSNLSGNTRVMAGLFDRTNASGTAGQFLRSTGTQVEWFTIPTVIPTLQQVLQSGNTSNISIVLTANLTAVTATANTVISNTSLNVNGVLRDGIAAAGGSNQILSSTGSGVRWVDMPVYNVISPLLYDTPTKTFSIQVANGSQGGYLSAADWINFDGKQNQILLTTAGNNGSSTFVGSTLNIPTYTLAGLGGVPTSRTLTINGVTYDLSANRSWTITAGVASVTATAPLSSSGGANPDISIQVANTSQSGYLTNTDWNTFNAKQGALTLTTTGTSGPSTLVGTTLNIPQYQSVLTNPITGTGTVNYVPKFDTTSSIANSNIQDSGTLITLGSDTTISSGALRIGTAVITAYTLSVSKNITGALTAYGVMSDGQIQSDVTNARMFNSKPTTIDSSFTITNLSHYLAQQGTYGASSTVSSQYGFFVDSSVVGAASNFAFRGQIPSAANNWNIYMDGTASNYLAGSLGIGGTGLANINLRIDKSITGATTSYGIHQASTIQSDVTATAIYNSVSANTVASAFTLGALIYFNASQSTFGSGSAVTLQVGYNVAGNLIGATTNYGFRGLIPSGTNRWNLYMDGTAPNYMAGALGIGTNSLTGYGLRLNVNITGSISSVAFYNSGAIQSDVTSSAYYNRTLANTVASSFTITNIYHYGATQGTFGAGSTVTNQFGFLVANSLTGATNNYAFGGQLAAATGAWNLYMSGSANNYLAGSLGIGATTLTQYNLRVSKNITGATIAFGITSDGVVQSDVTNQTHYYSTNAQTQATTFTLNSLFHYRAIQGTLGTGSTVTNQFGYYVDSTLIGATNNYGFYGNIPAQTGAWNLYMNGTANNYLAGSLGIGATTLTGISLKVSKNITGATLSYGIYQQGIVQSDVTDGYGFYNDINTATATFTVNGYRHYIAAQNAIGAGSTVTTQYGFVASASLIGATTNYGFYGGIPSGTNNWNLFMQGTAKNYLSGNLSIGSTNDNGLKLQVTGQSYFSDSVGIGTATLTGFNLNVTKNLTGAVNSSGIKSTGTVQSDVTGIVRNFDSVMALQATAFTLSEFRHYSTFDNSISGGAAVTTQTGFYASSNFASATNNYGFRGQIVAAASNWNLYMDGTAQNYLAGALSIGVTTANASALLQVDSTTKGFLPPRMTATQRAAISSPAEGLIVVQTDGTLGMYIYINAVWRTLAMV